MFLGPFMFTCFVVPGKVVKGEGAHPCFHKPLSWEVVWNRFASKGSWPSIQGKMLWRDDDVARAHLHYSYLVAVIIQPSILKQVWADEQDPNALPSSSSGASGRASSSMANRLV